MTTLSSHAEVVAAGLGVGDNGGKRGGGEICEDLDAVKDETHAHGSEVEKGAVGEGESGVYNHHGHDEGHDSVHDEHDDNDDDDDDESALLPWSSPSLAKPKTKTQGLRGKGGFCWLTTRAGWRCGRKRTWRWSDDRSADGSGSGSGRGSSTTEVDDFPDEVYEVESGGGEVGGGEWRKWSRRSRVGHTNEESQEGGKDDDDPFQNGNDRIDTAAAIGNHTSRDHLAGGCFDGDGDDHRAVIPPSPPKLASSAIRENKIGEGGKGRESKRPVLPTIGSSGSNRSLKRKGGWGDLRTCSIGEGYGVGGDRHCDDGVDEWKNEIEGEMSPAEVGANYGRGEVRQVSGSSGCSSSSSTGSGHGGVAASVMSMDTVNNPGCGVEVAVRFPSSHIMQHLLPLNLDASVDYN